MGVGRGVGLRSLGLACLITACTNEIKSPDVVPTTDRVILDPERWTRPGWPSLFAAKLFPGDMDGDGRTDLVTVQPNGRVTVGLSSGRQFKPEDWGEWSFLASARVEIADLDGDGRSDVIVFEASASGTIRVLRSTGGGFLDLGRVGALDRDVSSSVLLGDFNGDARVDIAVVSEGSEARVDVLLSNGAAFEPARSWGEPVSGHNRLMVGDFDGDGRQDIVSFEEGTSAELVVQRSAGDHFESSSWGAWPLASSGLLALGDFDGDRRDDLVLLGQRHGLEVARSTGAAFAIDFQPVADTPALTFDTQIFAGDFSGDGRADVLTVAPSLSRGVELAISGPGQFHKQSLGGSVHMSSARSITGDMNGDGTQDLAQIESNGEIVVRLGLAPCPKPTAPIFAPGRRYVIRFEDPIDDAPIGTEWRSDTFAASPLAPMTRPVILKADDLRGGIGSGFLRYLSLMADRELPATAGLIADRLRNAPEANRRCLSSFRPETLELWCHGYDHRLRSSGAEFSGVPVEEQLSHLRRAVDEVKVLLRITMQTFGAPGNSTDASTVEALSRMPELDHVFFAPEVPGKLNLAHSLDIEDSKLLIHPPAKFRSAFSVSCASRKGAPESCPQGAVEAPVVLQLHPDKMDWTEETWRDLEANLQYLEVEEGRGFMTAIGYSSWLAERDNVLVEKTSEDSYLVDLHDVRTPLALRFTERPTLVRAR